MKVIDLMIYLNICNDVIILCAMILYTYTICLLRSAIAHTSSFQFDTKGTYVITGLFFFSFGVQITYLLTYTLSDYSVVVDILLHKLCGLLEVLTIYIMLERTGSGLKLVSHQLNDGSI